MRKSANIRGNEIAEKLVSFACFRKKAKSLFVSEKGKQKEAKGSEKMAKEAKKQGKEAKKAKRSKKERK
jgi:hypothetical protein